MNIIQQIYQISHLHFFFFWRNAGSISICNLLTTYRVVSDCKVENQMGASDGSNKLLLRSLLKISHREDSSVQEKRP